MSGREAARCVRHGRLWDALAIIVVATAVLAASAGASLSKSKFRAQRVCSASRPGLASCQGLRLISKSLTATELKTRASRQAHEVQADGKSKVTSTSPPEGGLTPANLHEAYSLPTETAGSASQTIAIVDAYDDPTAEADLAVYSSTFGLPACTTKNGCFTKVNEQGKPSPKPKANGEWASEISLDVQMAHGVCENCKILLVEAASTSFSDLGAAVGIANRLGATEISNSYGGAESESEQTDYWGTPYVVVTVSSGDCGYYNQGCTGGIAAANYPASLSDVIAVGGTSLSHSSGHWASTVWNNGGSGCSKVFSAFSQDAVSGFSATGCGYDRSVADVAAVGDPYTGVDVYDTTPTGSGSSTGWGVWGGTSAASPIVAAEAALGGGAHGAYNPSAALYSHFGQSSRLYDVTSGTNGSCGGTTACRATTGFDGPTGIGSPIGTGAFIPSGAPTTSAPLTISGTAEAGQSLSISEANWAHEASIWSWAICNSSGADCTTIPHATELTYTLPATAVGSTIRAIEEPFGSGGQGQAVWSAPSAVVVANVPGITGISPATGKTGTTVTITGKGLANASKVSFGSLAARFGTNPSTNAIEAIVPNGASASTVTVTTASGKKLTSTTKFTPSLSVTGLSPGRAARGATVTISGVGFAAGSNVLFDGIESSSVTVLSSTSIKAVVPAEAGTGPVTVIAEPGVAVESAGSFVIA